MFGYRSTDAGTLSPEDDELIEPKRVSNLNHNTGKANVGTHPKEIKLFPLELRPILNQEDRRKQSIYQAGQFDSNTSLSSSCECHRYYAKRCRIPRRIREPSSRNINALCNCASVHNVYRNILGPTPDESILAGLQTVIDLCGLVDCCRSDSEERFCPFYQTTFESYAVPKAKKSKSHSKDEVPLHLDDIVPRAPSHEIEPPEEVYRTPTLSSIGSKHSPPRDSSSKQHVSIQDSPPRSPPPEPAEGNDETSGNCCKIDRCCGTASGRFPCVKRQESKEGCKCELIRSSLSAKSFPPVEIPPRECSSLKCHIVDQDFELSDLDVRIRRCNCPSSTTGVKKLSKFRHGRKDSKAVVIQDPKAGMSLVFDPRYTCNKDYVPPAEKVPKNFRLTRTMPPVVQPVIGVCAGKCAGGGAADGGGGADGSGNVDSKAERLLEVRYALVRISVFQNYTTYEIMKSSKKKPRKIPDRVEGIFVTKR